MLQRLRLKRIVASSPAWFSTLMPPGLDAVDRPIPGFKSRIDRKNRTQSDCFGKRLNRMLKRICTRKSGGTPDGDCKIRRLISLTTDCATAAIQLVPGVIAIGGLQPVDHH